MLDNPQLTETDDDCFPHNGRRLDPVVAGNGNVHAAARTKSLRVLIVDDDLETADSMSEAVRGWGHDVWCAYDVTAGLKLAEDHAPEVALVDIALAGMEGYALAQRLRRDARLKGCFLVALRWRTDRRRQEKYRATDFDLYLAKPVDAFVLETLLMMEAERVEKRAQNVSFL